MAFALIALMVTLAGCGGQDAGAGTLMVFAASSLAEPFEAIGEAFAEQRSDLDVVLNLAGSQQLVTQISQGAQADVVATADEVTMDRLETADGLDGDPRVFARNRLQIVVREGNPEGISALADLARADLVVVLAAPEVPAGAYSRRALGAAGVSVEPRSLEHNVRQVLSKVALGEADAGIVYVTDVLSAGSRVQGIDIPDEHNVEGAYPIAILRTARDQASARAFVDFILSPDGQAVLSEFGFLPS